VNKNTIYSVGFMNYCSHDPGVGIVKLGKNGMDFLLVEEGFLSRKKKSYQFPIRSLNYCLEYFGITIDDVDVFTVDYMDSKRWLRTSDNYRLLAGDYIRSKLKVDMGRVKYIDSHHLAHAYTAYYPSGFEEAVVVVIDGLGSEQQTHSVYKASKLHGIELLFEQKGTGIGRLYTEITEKLGFDDGEEGKTTGLAPYGQNEEEQDCMLPDLKGINNGMQWDYSRQINRAPNNGMRITIDRCAEKEEVYSPYYTRLAYNLQKETERCVLGLVEEAIRATGISNVCLAGGVALNCVANSVVQDSPLVKNLYIQPAAGDTGVPLGLAMYGAHLMSNEWDSIIQKKITINKLRAPYLTDARPMSDEVDDAVDEVLKKYAIKKKKIEAVKIASFISEGKIISFYQDGIEVGPRALGHRSFIADARSPLMKEKMNKNIKHREGYRPFAPMVLENHFNDYYISKTDKHPYMLQAPRCREVTKEVAPATVHVDGTARVQTVNSSCGRIYDVLREYYILTGVPIVINTSFNDNNEPIVFSMLDALCCFARTNADVLVVNDWYIMRADIVDIDSFRSDCEKIQKQICDNYFVKSLLNNTCITAQNDTTDLIRFMKYNMNLTSYFKGDRVLNKLVDFLLQRDVSRLVILDDYHYNLIGRLGFLINNIVSSCIPYYKIVDDNVNALEFIESNSDIILYNASAFFYTKTIAENNKEVCDVRVFYKLNDKLVRPLDSVHENNDKTIVDFLKTSYENDARRTISDFFDGIEFQ